MRNSIVLLVVAGCSSSSSPSVTLLPDSPLPPDAGPTPVTLATPLATGGLLVGIQDGDGPWTAIAPTSPGMYTFEVSHDRYGVAVTCLNASAVTYPFVAVDEVAIADATSLTSSIECSAALADLSGTITPATLQNLVVAWGDTIGYGDNGTFDVSAHGGSHDAIALTYDPASGAYDAAVVQRGVAAGSSPALDFSGGGAQLEPHVVVATGAVDQVSTAAILSTTDGTNVETSYGSPDQVEYVPQSLLVATERYATVTYGLGADGHYANHIHVSHTIGDSTADLSATTTQPTVGWVDVSPIVRLQASWTAQAGAGAYVLVATANNSQWQLEVSPQYDEQPGPVTLAIPDLDNLAGFPSSLDLPPSVDYAVAAVSGGTYAMLADFGPFTPDGDYSVAGWSGSVTQ
ncbi:MAG TPA: hypothetical protein VMJ10_13425 [Kofleriaceae bacterium]|nr:hypothetical protein [Kofleriaceae bacterium]